MDARRLLKELEQVAAGLGVRVRTEQLRTRQTSAGGLCVIRGQRVVLLNSRVSESERVIALADILAPLVDEGASISEAATALLRTRQPGRRAEAAATRKRGPGLRRCAPKN